VITPLNFGSGHLSGYIPGYLSNSLLGHLPDTPLKSLVASLAFCIASTLILISCVPLPLPRQPTEPPLITSWPIRFVLWIRNYFFPDPDRIQHSFKKYIRLNPIHPKGSRSLSNKVYKFKVYTEPRFKVTEFILERLYTA
jgi:hypothetical protein